MTPLSESLRELIPPCMSLSKSCSNCAQTGVALFACQKPPHGRNNITCGTLLCKPCYMAFREVALLCPQAGIVCYRKAECPGSCTIYQNPAIRCGCGKAVCDTCFDIDEFISQEKCQICIDKVKAEKYKEEHYGGNGVKREGGDDERGDADAKRARLGQSNGEARR